MSSTRPSLKMLSPLGSWSPRCKTTVLGPWKKNALLHAWARSHLAVSESKPEHENTGTL